MQRVFDRSCTGECHGLGRTDDFMAGLDKTSNALCAEMLDATRSRNGPQIVAGDPDNSLLVGRWRVWVLRAVEYLVTRCP